MHANRSFKWTVPFAVVCIVIFGTLSSRLALAQDSGPHLFLPLVASRSEKLIDPNISGYFVTTEGKSRGDGSRSHPWDLQTALNGPDAVGPGDTIWVMGGTYGSGGDTQFESRLQGAEDRPITVRAVPGERVRIDGGIEVKRPWTTFWGLEVFNSNTDRVSSEPGSHPADIARNDGFTVAAPHTALINNVIHDTRQGVGFWSEAPDSLLYGNLIYNNGWQAPDRGHGHGVYGQNESGRKWILDNIIFSNFSGYNLHIFSTNGFLNNFVIQGNTLINGELLVGSVYQPAQQIQVTENNLFNSRAALGFKYQGNRDLVFQENRIYHNEGASLEIKWWHDLQVSGNRVWNSRLADISFYYPGTWGSYRLNNNDYYAPNTTPFTVDEDKKTWSQWQGDTGFDGSSTFSKEPPSGVEVILRPNQYENGRGTIIIYNWDHLDQVPVDLSGLGLKPGERYSLHNVQNFFKDPIQGTYTGEPVRIPMQGWSAVRPIGYGEPLAQDTFPQFGVFELIVE